MTTNINLVLLVLFGLVGSALVLISYDPIVTATAVLLGFSAGAYAMARSSRGDRR